MKDDIRQAVGHLQELLEKKYPEAVVKVEIVIGNKNTPKTKKPKSKDK